MARFLGFSVPSETLASETHKLPLHCSVQGFEIAMQGFAIAMHGLSIAMQQLLILLIY
jgi:hypothetical protein